MLRGCLVFDWLMDRIGFNAETAIFQPYITAAKLYNFMSIINYVMMILHHVIIVLYFVMIILFSFSLNNACADPEMVRRNQFFYRLNLRLWKKSDSEW